jgi:hypothetical protein
MRWRTSRYRPITVTRGREGSLMGQLLVILDFKDKNGDLAELADDAGL